MLNICSEDEARANDCAQPQSEDRKEFNKTAAALREMRRERCAVRRLVSEIIGEAA